MTAKMNYNSTVGFSYKLVDETGYVLRTGSWIEMGLDVGDKFNGEFKLSHTYLSEASEYTILITDR